MKKRNKIIALLLAMTMCGTALVGCGSDPKSSESTDAVSTETVTNSETSVATEPVATEPLKNADVYPLNCDKTFEVVTSGSLFTESDSIIVTERMEEATGVSIKWESMTTEQLQLMLTGKDFPDAIFMFSGGMDKATAYEYGQGGFLVNFMDYLDIMPNFSALIEAYPEALEVAQNEDGSVYLLPVFSTTNTVGNNTLYYRTDMMKEIGWENPPATTDEFIEYIKALQEHYGATDKEYIAFNPYRLQQMTWKNKMMVNYFFASFGELVLTDITIDSKENVVLGAATEQYKHYLEFMNEVWNSGAFNTNIYTQDEAASQALNAGNHVGVTAAHTGLTLANFESGNFDLDVMPALTSEYWDTPHWYQSSGANAVSKTCVLSTSCEDIETMVKWFDAWYAPADDPLNEEGTMWGITPWMGEIGVDFAFDDETMVYTELEHEGVEKGKFLATQSFSGCVYNGYENGRFPYSADKNTNTGVKGNGTTRNLWPYAETPTDIAGLTLTQDEQDIYNDAYADIDGYITEMTAKFITGELNIEESWNKYLTDLDKMGLTDVIKVYQDAYNRSKAE